MRAADSNVALPDGRYALTINGKVYDFLVNKESSDPDHCADQIIRDLGTRVEFTRCGEIDDPKLKAQSMLRRGQTAAEAKDYDRAIVDFTEAIRLNPNDNLSFVSRGNAYHHKKDFERAIADFSVVIQRLLPQERAWGFGFRGNVYMDMKDYDRAIADYTEATHSRSHGLTVVNCSCGQSFNFRTI